MSAPLQTVSPWDQARLAAALLAIDPGLGGALVRARAGPACEAWLELVRRLMTEDAPWRRIPVNINDEALLGGIDLAATLKTGRATHRPGLLSQMVGGTGVLAMAERAEPGLAARLSAALDGPSAPLLIALDEAADPEERVPGALAERLAFHIDLSAVTLSEVDGESGLAVDIDPEAITMARVRLMHILNGDAERALTETALALGVDSLRPPILAVRAARAAAALFGQDEVSRTEAALAAQLVLAPRARRLPQPEQAEPEAPHDDRDEDDRDAPPDSSDETGDDDTDARTPDELTEVTLEAARAAIPDTLLARIEAGRAGKPRGGAGKAGAACKEGPRGRPAGSRRGDPGEGRRLDVMATLRAAAPWGKARRKGLARFKPGPALEVRREDFRIKRFKPRAETLTIFVVDASGSLALNRLAEAKGAVETMLAQSYVRRDQVALIAFKGTGPETVLPPTRSLTRAKRSLAALPGGGGTPLAAAIEAAEALAHASARQGRSVTLVFLTDGAANVTRDGAGSREIAQAEARDAARRLAAAGHAAILVDVSKRGADTAKFLAEAMAARYVRLPVADSGALADLARKAAA
ncbi:MAG: magnesium chelatase subunit D [Oceanicaulis sp.]